MFFYLFNCVSGCAKIEGEHRETREGGSAKWGGVGH